MIDGELAPDAPVAGFLPGVLTDAVPRSLRAELVVLRGADHPSNMERPEAFRDHARCFCPERDAG